MSGSTRDAIKSERAPPATCHLPEQRAWQLKELTRYVSITVASGYLLLVTRLAIHELNLFGQDERKKTAFENKNTTLHKL